MKRNECLSVALHVLLHLGERPDQAMTSEKMAACVGTHAVVIRRTFAGLREAGIVVSVKGHGGGWRLARPPADVNLAEIQLALGLRVVSLTPPKDSPGCLVERAVGDALGAAMREAEQVLNRRLAALTLADLAVDVRRLHAAPSQSGASSHGR